MKTSRSSPKKKSKTAFLLVTSRIKPSGLASRTGHAGVDRSLGFLAEKFCRPIQLEDLVKVSRMSRRGFFKAFVKRVGVNPGAYLRALRIEYAKHLLVEQDLKLEAIAPKCGYRSVNSFCIAFTREVKTSPKKFQRQYWLAVCRHQQLSRQLFTAGHQNAPLLTGTALLNVDGSRQLISSQAAEARYR